MFTNNYIAFRFNMFMGLMGTNGSNGVTNLVYGKSCVTVTGATNVLMSAVGQMAYIDIGRCMEGRCKALLTAKTSSYANTNGLYFGSGTTPATKEDYTLESPITSGLSIVNGDFHIENGVSGQYSISRDYVVTNTSENDITISEIGCFGGWPLGTSEYHQVLWERTVLSSPITIPAGESKAVTYKITFNQPS